MRKNIGGLAYTLKKRPSELLEVEGSGTLKLLMDFYIMGPVMEEMAGGMNGLKQRAI